MPYVTRCSGPTTVRQVKCGRVTESTQLSGTTLASPDRPRCRNSCPNFNRDRKSTRLNSSHLVISYAVFCLKKKKNADFSYYKQLTSVIGRLDIVLVTARALLRLLLYRDS